MYAPLKESLIKMVIEFFYRIQEFLVYRPQFAEDDLFSVYLNILILLMKLSLD
jgi:hypothetical protein